MAQSIQNFVESRKPRWERLEMLIKTLEHRRKKNQPAWDPLELARLYREATSDLARLQSFRKEASDPEDLEIYLNQLVGRAYGRIYRTPPPSWASLWNYLRSTFPEIFLKTAPWTLTALGIFLLGSIYGFVVALTDDSFITLLAPPQLIQQVEEGKVWFDSILAVRPLASSMIMTNNISVCFLSFALGITFGLGTIYLMAFNGLMLGALAGLCYTNGLGIPFWSFVLPHGVIELTAIFISGGAGLLLGTALWVPGDLSRKEALTQRGRQAGLLVIGCVPLLIVAGIIEGFFSPAPFPAALKFVVAVILFLLLLLYLLSPRLIKAPAASLPGSAPWWPEKASPVEGP
jgi:uncharacterized membrane protein SpoIIM required for sporulation